MKIPFSELSDSARIWIYPSSRKFYDDEILSITSQIEFFLQDWFQEEKPVAFSIQYNRFLVFGVNSEDAIQSAEIDKMVAFILHLQKEYEVELLDRMNVCFKQGEFVQYKELKDFQTLIKQRAVSKNTIVFDNLIENKGDFDSFWEIPITESWYNRFVK